MTYDWYKVFNKTDFEDTGLTSREYSIILDERGAKDILVTKGVAFSVCVDGVFLTINLNDRNPYEFDDRAVYIDDNDDVWVGYLVDED